MDEGRFDGLTKLVARSRSRRQLLHAVGGIIAAAAGRQAVAAQDRCKAGAALCATDAQCCSGTCDRTTGRCTCGGGTILCGGRCISACTALDDCHVAGVCDPNSGRCTNPPAPAGTQCGQGPRCRDGVATGHDVCDGAGACAAGPQTTCAPYACGDTACRTSCSDASECAHGYSCSGGTCQTRAANGAQCTGPEQCQSGNCVGGICCASAQCQMCETCASGACAPVPDNTNCGTDKACCGGQCTDLTTITNCGSCGRTCPADGDGATPVCVRKECAVTCRSGFHPCGGSCAPDDSVAQCGTACIDCAAAAPPHTIVKCSRGSCAYACDTAHGATPCGTSCCGSGETCCDGICRLDTGSPCQHDDDCCSGFCVGDHCQAACSADGQPCSDDADCCANGKCLDINGNGICCSGLVCGGQCCKPDTACTTASCAEGGCSYTIKPNCCAQDSDCHSTAACQQATCDLTTHTCQEKPVNDGASCGTNQICCQENCCGSGQLCAASGCCTPDDPAKTCAGKCGTMTNNCGQSIECTARCTGCCNGSVCETGTTDDHCGSNGAACVTCGGGDQTCGSHCTASASGHACQYARRGTVCGQGDCAVDRIYVPTCDGQGKCIPKAHLCDSTFCQDDHTCGACDPSETNPRICFGCVYGYCTSVGCLRSEGLGQVCKETCECRAGEEEYCVDGTCCSTPSCKPCESCANNDGVCRSLCADNQDCCDGVCRTKLKQACQQDYECCGAHGAICTFYQVPSAPDKVCCLPVGAACSTFLDCCSANCNPDTKKCDPPRQGSRH